MQQYVDFAGLLYTMLVKKPAAADIEQIVRVSGRRIFTTQLSLETHTHRARDHMTRSTQHAARIPRHRRPPVSCARAWLRLVNTRSNCGLLLFAFLLLQDAVAVEKDFIVNEFKAEVLGIAPAEMERFVEHTADLLMSTFKQQPIYNVGQPFDWMNRKELAVATSNTAVAPSVSPMAAKAAAMGQPAAMDQVLSFGMDDDDF